MISGVLLVLTFCITASPGECKRVIKIDRDIPVVQVVDYRSLQAVCNKAIALHAVEWMLGRPGWTLKEAHCRRLPWIEEHT